MQYILHFVLRFKHALGIYILGTQLNVESARTWGLTKYIFLIQNKVA